jgi:hypothetical protein
VLDESVRALVISVAQLNQIVRELHDRVVAASERWHSSAERYEALVREILEQRRKATGNRPSPQAASPADR